MKRPIPGIRVAALAQARRGNASDFAHVARGTPGAPRDRMYRLASVCLCLAVSACFDGTHPLAADDIVGPYTGARTRYVVDSLVLPRNNNDARAFGTDINNDKTPDNQLGMVAATLFTMRAIDEHVADRIASGELDMVVEIQADDLQNDERAGVWVYGFGDTDVRPTGGEFVGGAFVPNFIRATAPENTGSATIPMPLIQDADTSRMDVPFMEISLVPDGRGGYDAQIHGAIRNASATARLAIEQQLNDRPEDHRLMWSFVDKSGDGVISPGEWTDSLVHALVAPDLELEGEQLLSFGIGFHLIPCPSGNCALSTPAEPCFDRVRDNDETDVDCGGSCGPCGAALACVSDTDCQSGTCGTGVCTAPSCEDGIKNGLEASSDCGGSCARNCAIGQVCGLDLDCDDHCTAGIGGGVGTCAR